MHKLKQSGLMQKVKKLFIKPRIQTKVYHCPSCDHAHITAIPDKGKVYEALITCSSCGIAHHKHVNDKGEVVLS